MNQYLDLDDVLKVVEAYEDKYSIYYGYKGAVLNALAQGYSVSVYDGEEWSLERSKSFKQIIEEIEGNKTYYRREGDCPLQDLLLSLIHI